MGKQKHPSQLLAVMMTFCTLRFNKCADFLKNNDFRVAYGKAIIVDGKSLNDKNSKISAQTIGEYFF